MADPQMMSSTGMDMNNTDMNMGGMMMWLHWSASEYGVLFRSWNFLTPGQYGGFCIAIILMCILKEFLFAWRMYRLRPTVSVVNIASDSFIPTEQLERQPVASSSAASRNSVRVVKQTLSNRIVGSILYAVNLFFGYMIMLLIMTYNWGFIFCIIFGSAAGHCVFSWLMAPDHTERVEADCCEK